GTSAGDASGAALGSPAAAAGSQHQPFAASAAAPESRGAATNSSRGSGECVRVHGERIRSAAGEDAHGFADPRRVRAGFSGLSLSFDAGVSRAFPASAGGARPLPAGLLQRGAPGP